MRDKKTPPSCSLCTDSLGGTGLGLRHFVQLSRVSFNPEGLRSPRFVDEKMKAPSLVPQLEIAELASAVLLAGPQAPWDLGGPCSRSQTQNAEAVGGIETSAHVMVIIKGCPSCPAEPFREQASL